MANPESGSRYLIEMKSGSETMGPQCSKSFLQIVACDHLLNFLPFDFSVVLALDVPELWAPHDALVHGAHGQVLVVLFWPRFIHGLSVSTLACNLKGSLTRDFRLKVFFLHEPVFPPSVLIGPFWIFYENSRDICNCNFVFITCNKLFTCVNNTDGGILSPVSLLPAIKTCSGLSKIHDTSD